MPRYTRTAAAFQAGSRALGRESYTSAHVFASEQELIFGRRWNCVGRAATLARAGDYRLASIGGESLVVVRGRDRTIRAFFNVCRHRGTRLCEAASGTFPEVIRCPYHAWTYTTEGALIGAPHMQDVDGFDMRDFPLHEAAVVEAHGFLFLNTSDDPEPFNAWFAPMAERLARFELATLDVRRRVEYDVRANWKLVFENYSECLHCPVIHPELAAVLPYQSGANDLIDGAFLGGYMDIAAGRESATLTGQRCAPFVSASLPEADRRRAFYYSVMPNLLLSVHPDYVNYYLLTPVAADRTTITSEWLFRSEPDREAFNPDDAVSFWDVVNRQDWQIVEQCQAGIASSRYSPGPYSPRESISAAWDREYLRLMSGKS